MSKRAAIYARVSTKDQKDNGYSLPTQIEACAAYATERGYVLVGEPFQDDYTGMSMDRPALDKLREAITTAHIDVVIVLDLDRLARKAVYQMLLEEEFAKLGAVIEYANGRYEDSDEGRLQKTIRAAVAEYERAKILERMKRGKAGKVKSGKVLTGQRPPYGYRCVGDLLAVDETEAEIVRLIYGWYTGPEQLSMHQIALRLTERHVPTRKRTASWGHSTVGIILKSETYAGTWHYRKRDTRVEQGKQVTRKRPREDWLPVPIPAIVDAETFAQARERAAENLTHARRNRKHLYLFSGMLTCGGCGRLLGGTYHYTVAQRYLCTLNRKESGTRRCHLLTMTRESLIRSVVWPWLCGIIDDPARTSAALAEQQALAEAEFAPLRARLATIEAQLADHDRQLRRVLDTHARNTDLPLDVLDAWLTEQKTRLKQARADLERERADLHTRLQQADWTPAQCADVEAFCAQLRGRMANATPEQMRATLVLVRFKGRLTVEEGVKVLYAQCVLGKERLPLISSITTRR